MPIPGKLASAEVMAMMLLSMILGIHRQVKEMREMLSMSGGSESFDLIERLKAVTTLHLTHAPSRALAGKIVSGPNLSSFY